MNKKGFTLVELLVVIVILALLIIITAFTTLKILNKTKVDIEEINVKRYIQDVNNAIFLANATNDKINDGIYYINSDSLGEKIPIKINSSIKPQGEDDYVVIENGEVIKYKISSKGYVITDIGNFSETTVEEWVNVKDFGAVGDGITDDTTAIKNAVKEINQKGGTLYFPYGVYLVSAQKYQDTILNINSEKVIIVEMNSSTIKLKENNYPYYNIFMINKSADVYVKNGTLIGDRIRHDYTGYTEKSRTHEFGYGIYVYYSNKVVISNMNISQMTGDAVINKTGTSSGTTNYTLIENSELSYSRRQGLSVLDTDKIELNNVYIHHIGTFDGINGTAPKSGIDVEPASGTKVVNSIVLNNVKIENTESFGIIQGAQSKANQFIVNNSDINNLNIRNAEIANSTLNYVNSMTSTLTNCVINNSHIKHYAKNTDLNFVNTKIEKSVIEGLNDPLGNRLFLKEGTQINNSKIMNYLGKTNERGLSKVNAGLVIESQEEFSNNTYNNIVLINSVNVSEDYIFNDVNSTIENSFIGFTGNQNVIINNVNFNNITFKTNLYNKGYNRTMFFNDCLIKDSTISDAGKLVKVYDNTKIIKDGIELDRLD